jgi:hypothetical protein
LAAEVRKSPAEDRSQLVREFCSGCPPEEAKAVYIAVAAFDRRAAFRALVPASEVDEVDYTVGPPHPNQVRAWTARDEVITLHTDADATDPYLAYVRGQLRMQREDFAGADALFAAAEAKIPPPNPGDKAICVDWESDPGPGGDRYLVRSARLTAWYKQGKGVAALKEFGHTDEVFDTLARMYGFDKNADGLDRLVAAYADKSPAEKGLSYWCGKVAFLKKDDAKAATLFRKHLDSLTPDEKYDPYRHASIDLLIRSFARLNLPAKMKWAADRYGLERWDHILKVFVAATHRDVDAVSAAMTVAAGNHPNEVAAIHRDEDVGPLLRLPEFKAVREKFPDTDSGK